MKSPESTSERTESPERRRESYVVCLAKHLGLGLLLVSGCGRPPVDRVNTFPPEDMATPSSVVDFSWPMDSRYCPPPPGGTWRGKECSGCWCYRNDAGNITDEMVRMAKLCDEGDKEANIFCGNLPIQ